MTFLEGFNQYKIIMKESGLQKSMESMREKIDLLMGGENEANKLIDCILPSLTTIESKVGSRVPDPMFLRLQASPDPYKIFTDPDPSIKF